MNHLPSSSQLPVEILARCFENTTNSYKFYWFLAILDHVQANNSDEISMQKLALQMIAEVWYPLNFYRLSFGKQDSFKNVAQFVSQKITIDDKSAETLFQQLEQKIQPSDLEEIYKQINTFIKYVPYRFLRPFFSLELKGIKDNQVNQKITEFAVQQFLEKRLFYKIENQKIILNPDWKVYFQKHYSILKGFIFWQLVKFLQKHNPNVIGLSEKIEPPKRRNLSSATKYWQIFLGQKTDFQCIYSGQKIENNLSIDHFVPWSYTAHDELWNLLPVPKNVNSAKNNSLPNLDFYLTNFVDLQYDAFHLVLREKGKSSKKLFESFNLLFALELDEIIALPKADFCKKITDNIKTDDSNG